MVSKLETKGRTKARARRGGSSVCTHAETRDVDAVDVYAVGLDDVIE